MSFPTRCDQERVVLERITYFHGLEEDPRLMAMRIRLRALSQHPSGSIDQRTLDHMMQQAADFRHKQLCSDPFIGKGKLAKRLRAKVLGVCFRCARWNCRLGWRYEGRSRLRIRCDRGRGIRSLERAEELEFIKRGIDASPDTIRNFTHCELCRRFDCRFCTKLREMELDRFHDYAPWSDDEPDTN